MEVLVALAVLSIGLLGMAGMQLYSLKSSHNAYLTSQATNFAYELVDKMRANRDQAIAGAYDTDFTSMPGGLLVNCQISNCAPQQLAIFELAQWKCALGSYEADAACSNNNGLDLNSILPNGDGEVERGNSSRPNLVTVTVRWTERTDNLADAEDVMIVAEL